MVVPVLYVGCSGGAGETDDSSLGGASSGGRGGEGGNGLAGEGGWAGAAGMSPMATGGKGPTGGRGGTDGGGTDGGGGRAGTGSAAGNGGEGGTAPEDLPLAGEICAGYTLVGSPENDAGPDFEAFLIDLDGNVVHTWGITGFPPKFLPGGSLLGCSGVHPMSYDCVEMRQLDWERNLEWSFANWESTGGQLGARHHHDFFRGNRQLSYYAPFADLNPRASTFILAHTLRTVPSIREDVIDDDAIYEVTEDGELGEFLWRGADHFEQFGFDEEAKADIAGRNLGGRLELLHGNSITPVGPNRWYDAGRPEFHPDNIIYSSRQANFVVIIDRQTGDVVWRIGPDVPGRPEESLGQFVGQHHPHMIPRGLPGAGNILLYDNGGAAGYGGPEVGEFRYSRDYSRVIEFNPITFEVVWEYGAPSGDQYFRSRYLSNAQRLPNGNTLITVGTQGQIREVTPDKRIVWTYQFVPTDDSGKKKWVYRSYRIPPEWLPAGVNAEHGGYKSWQSLFE